MRIENHQNFGLLQLHGGISCIFLNICCLLCFARIPQGTSQRIPKYFCLAASSHAAIAMGMHCADAGEKLQHLFDEVHLSEAKLNT